MTDVSPVELARQLADLRQTDPDTVRDVLSTVKAEQDHRIDMERMDLKAKIAQAKWGLLAGWSIAIFGLLVAGWVILKGDGTASAVAGGAIGTVDLVALVTVFLVQTARSNPGLGVAQARSH